MSFLPLWKLQRNQIKAGTIWGRARVDMYVLEIWVKALWMGGGLVRLWNHSVKWNQLSDCFLLTFTYIRGSSQPPKVFTWGESRTEGAKWAHSLWVYSGTWLSNPAAAAACQLPGFSLFYPWIQESLSHPIESAWMFLEDCCWPSSITLATQVQELSLEKDPEFWKRLKSQKKGLRDKIIGQHHTVQQTWWETLELLEDRGGWCTA